MRMMGISKWEREGVWVVPKMGPEMMKMVRWRRRVEREKRGPMYVVRCANVELP